MKSYKNTSSIVFHLDIKTLENNERIGEAKLFISFECFWTIMKHLEQVFHMTSQTHEQTEV